MPSQKTPLASVIMAARNAEPWIAEAIRSVLEQSLEDLELIVVDDGSSDRTRDVAGSFGDPRITVLTQTSQGACSARNRGLAASRGRFIQFLDADDILAPQKLSAQIAAIDTATPALAACVAPFVVFYDGKDPTAGQLDETVARLGPAKDPKSWYARLLGGDGPVGMVPTVAWLCPRALLERAGPWDESLRADQDGEYFCRVAAASDEIVVAPEPLGYYRKFWERRSLSSSNSGPSLASRLAALESKRCVLGAGGESAVLKTALAKQYFHIANLAFPLHPRLSRSTYARCRELAPDASRFGDYLRLEPVRRAFGWRTARFLRFLLEAVARRLMP